MELRTQTDRRSKPTSMFSRYTMAGRRTSFRRQEDKFQGGYVDLYGIKLFFCLIFIAFLNCLDAHLTSIILSRGGSEVNPFVRWAIEAFGINAWTLKFALVSVCLVILCLNSRFRYVKQSLVGIAIIYSGVILYQIALLQ